MSAKLIIFDCDGVLVDSEELANAVTAEMLSIYGHQITSEELIRRFKGMKFKTYIDILENETGIVLPKTFETDVRQRMAEVFKAKVKPLEGAIKIIKSLRVPFCVASNGPLNKTKENLQTTNLYQHFVGKIFSAYEVKCWKPEPGLFLAAAKHFEAKPQDCIVIEDSVSGVKAAIAAEMTVYALDHTGADKDLSIANRIFISLDDIHEFFVTQNLSHK